MTITEILDDYFNENNFTKEIYLKLYNLYDTQLASYHNRKIQDINSKIGKSRIAAIHSLKL